MRSIAVPRQMPDRRGRDRAAGRRRAGSGSRTCASATAPTRGVLHGIDLAIAPGERVGLVGPLGRRQIDARSICCCASTSSRRGRILIDGQDIADVTQESLRAPYRHGDAGHLAAPPLDPRQHPLRPARRERRARCTTRRRARPRARVHRGPRGLAGPARLRRACRRARRQALGRPAPAHRDRARHPEERADPGARRGDLGARFRGRGRDPGAARRPDARAAR